MDHAAQCLDRIGALKRRLLPAACPPVPGWRLAAYASQAAWAGGDHFDFLPLADGRLLLLIADASGHGGPAAVMVALARALLHSCPLSSGRERPSFCPLHAADLRPPEAILERLNRALFENSLEGHFMTAFLGILSPTSGALDFANAGHPLPRLWRAAHREVESVPDVASLPLAIDPGTAYLPARVALEPGDVLLCGTDGLTEAEDGAHEPFGWDRLDTILRRSAPAGAEAVKAALLAGLEEFLAGRPAQDDVTFVILERLAPQRAS